MLLISALRSEKSYSFNVQMAVSLGKIHNEKRLVVSVTLEKRGGQRVQEITREERGKRQGRKEVIEAKEKD